jgi:hypothetical protein
MQDVVEKKCPPHLVKGVRADLMEWELNQTLNKEHMPKGSRSVKV